MYYRWHHIKGNKGDKGDQGNQGNQGDAIIYSGYSLLEKGLLVDSMVYSYVDSTTTPANGKVSFGTTSSTNFSDQTQLLLSNINKDGNSATSWLSSLQANDKIKIINSDDTTKFGIYTITSINNSQSQDLTIDFNTGNGTVSENDTLIINNALTGRYGIQGLSGDKGVKGDKAPTDSKASQGSPGEKGGFSDMSSSLLTITFGDYIHHSGYDIILKNSYRYQYLATPMDYKQGNAFQTNISEDNGTFSLFNRQDTAEFENISHLDTLTSSIIIASLYYSLLPSINIYPQRDWSYYATFSLKNITLYLIQENSGSTNKIQDSIGNNITLYVRLFILAGDINNNSNGSFSNFDLTDKLIELNKNTTRSIAKNKIEAMSEWIPISNSRETVSLSNVQFYDLSGQEIFVQDDNYIWIKNNSSSQSNHAIGNSISLIYNFGNPTSILGQGKLSDYYREHWNHYQSNDIKFKKIQFSVEVEFVGS